MLAFWERIWSVDSPVFSCWSSSALVSVLPSVWSSCPSTQAISASRALENFRALTTESFRRTCHNKPQYENTWTKNYTRSGHTWLFPWPPSSAISADVDEEEEIKMKWIGHQATFVHIQAELSQEKLLRMVRWVRWHCPPDTGFKIQTMEVRGRAHYLSVMEAPHNTSFTSGWGINIFVSF